MEAHDLLPERLKVAIEDIPDDGLDLVGQLTAAWVAQLLRQHVYHTCSPATLSARLNRSADLVTVECSLQAELGFLCSRCAEESSQTLQESFVHRFAHRKAREANAENEIDFELTLYDGETVDLEPMLRERFVFAQAMAPLCSEQCAGLCRQCGHNLNRGSCQCASGDIDPRWEKLRKVKAEMGG